MRYIPSPVVVALSGLLAGACSSSSSPIGSESGTGGAVIPNGATGGSPGSGSAGSGGRSGTGGGGAPPAGSSSGGTAGALPSSGGAPGSGGAVVGTGGGTAGVSGAAGAATTVGATGGTTTGNLGGSGVAGAAVQDPGTDGDGDIMVGPTYQDSPDLAVKNVPHATRFQFSMSSTMSKVFPGTDAVLNNPTPWTRQVTVFIPKQYVDGAAAPFLVVQDGSVQGTATPMLQTIVENLAADPSPTRKIPPLVTIFVQNGGGDGPGSERGLEYDTVSDRYTLFINTEVLPAVLANTAIKAAFPSFKLTTDPEGRGAFGCSSGSPAAFGLGWFGDFHRLITYSGTFVNNQRADAATQAMYPDGAWGYSAMIQAAAPKPLRVFLEAAENDNGSTMTEASHHNWIIANRNMAAALKAKGYHYRFVYALGAGHCDAKVQRQTLPDTVSWMWRSYQPTP